MLTTVGKFLVLLNAFAAVAVLAWATSAYLTRVDAVDAVDPATGEKLTEKVKRLNDAAVTAQNGYAPALARVADADARLFVLRGNIAKRLKQADEGVFYDIRVDAPGVRDPNNPNALDRYGRITWTDDPAKQIKGLDGKPLAGVDQMRKNLIDEQTASAAHIDAIEKSVKELTKLNADITALDARYAWLEEVGKRHTNELPVLADLRVTWENRSGSLQRRRNQLLMRLEDLKGSKVGVVPTVPAPAGPSSFTLTPNK